MAQPRRNDGELLLYPAMGRGLRPDRSRAEVELDSDAAATRLLICFHAGAP